MSVRKNISFAMLLMTCLLMFSGYATFRPKPLEQIPFLERAQVQERDGLRVSVSVPTREETRQALSVDLEKKQIQPMWIQIENDTDEPSWFMLHGLDPNYYLAGEAAYMNPCANGP